MWLVLEIGDPTTIKECSSVLIPTITTIINLSLSSMLLSKNLLYLLCLTVRADMGSVWGNPAVYGYKFIVFLLLYIYALNSASDQCT